MTMSASSRYSARRHFLVAALLASGQGEVLRVTLPGSAQPTQCEAVPANWNQALTDAGLEAFAGEAYLEADNVGGCHPFTGSAVVGRLVVVNEASMCSAAPVVAMRAAAAGARGVVFYHHDDDPTGIVLGDGDVPRVRGVMIGRRHGEAIRESLAAGGRVDLELISGVLIAEDAYEEQFIFRQDEFLSTRATNFLWHTHPEMLPSSGKFPLSSRIMQRMSAPEGWFKSSPSFVPVFNPSISALDDGSLLVVVRVSNGPGCPSLRRAKETSMETRIFRNALLLAHTDAEGEELLSHVFVETPPFIALFTDDVEVGGRKFLDEVSGPMDARIVAAESGERWVSFYAEHNFDAHDVFRGIHAAPLHVEWRPCASSEAWSLHGDGSVLTGPSCRWLGSGDGSSVTNCIASCDARSQCNSANFGLGHCELRRCGQTSDVVPLQNWQAWRRHGAPSRWYKTGSVCFWIRSERAVSLKECQRVCEGVPRCDAVSFSESLSVCNLSRCDGDSVGEPLPTGWEGWRFGAPPTGRDCLESARLLPNEVIMFPNIAGGVEKNWNLIRVEHSRIYVEYHIEPHIVFAGDLERGEHGGVFLRSFGTLSISRWPYEILHGISNVRGGFCCLELPESLWPGRSNLVPAGPVLLGVGHLQRIRSPFDQAPGDVARFRRQAKSRTYHQFFYALRAGEPFDVVAVSTEWCVGLGGEFSEPWRGALAEGEEACESIQFASGLALRDEDTLTLAYGINDCEAGILALPLERVFGMLRPVRSDLNASLDDMEML